MGGDGPAVLRVARVPDIAAVLAGAGVPLGVPVLVLVGGAGDMDDEHERLLGALLRDAVLPVVAGLGAAVVDGATEVGVMRAVGRARAAAGAVFPLIGVAAEGTVVAPGHPPPSADAVALDRHHTHAVLVPGTAWGDESPWLADVAGAVAGTRPSVTLLANGGDIAYLDLEHSVDRGRPVLLLAGTGRTADAVATAGPGSDPRARRAAASRLVAAVGIDDAVAVGAAVRRALGAPAG
ncbi:hypothetical protein [Pseudonocardia humida]|uniref:LSDAT prokaryote domain-containing protein n=1 Tax=Pseudonocardia humida TaxID=2800819 RepID=A0ABT1A6L8_9PSEU|nr:hypothetical protein [Pseudonocardia humida]MCO1658650.1 hypothetical protein [Pseudonocardia humida]